MELLRQTKETFEESLGIEIGVIGEGVNDPKNVTVATIQTLINDIINKIDFNDFNDNEDVIGEIYEHMLNKYVKNVVNSTTKTISHKI
jgi:superfamily II DNA or RNA helicase